MEERRVCDDTLTAFTRLTLSPSLLHGLPSLPPFYTAYTFYTAYLALWRILHARGPGDLCIIYIYTFITVLYIYSCFGERGVRSSSTGRANGQLITRRSAVSPMSTKIHSVRCGGTGTPAERHWRHWHSVSRDGSAALEALCSARH